MREIRTEPLTAEAFAPFGDVLDAMGAPDRIINQGLCGRFHDRARLDFGDDGRAGISIYNAVPRELPLRLSLVERHPDGSQAFLPMTLDPFLVIVCPDEAGTPGRPRAFLTGPGQGVKVMHFNYPNI
jgi:ureidoglycolate lyase